jgi:hypothetical protein
VAPRIGEVLVRDGACAPEAVRTALQNQVIFGGRVGTNLLELEAVSEEALAVALSRRHGCGHVAGPVELDRAAVRAFPRSLADRWDVVPLARDDRTLTLLAVDPSNVAMIDEVAFAAGRRVVPVVAAEARVWALLRGAYGLVRELRGIELEDAGAAATPSPAAAPRPATAPGDLMGEAEFDALYGQVGTGAAQPLVAPPGAPRGPGSGRAPPPGDPSEDEVIDLTADMLEPGQGDLAPSTLAAAVPEPEPLGFAEALAALAGVAERTAVARVVLRYARARLRRTVLFTIHRGVAQGWVGLGGGLATAAPAIRLRLGSPGVLDTVVRTQAHYLGPLPRTEANVRLLRALGGGVPGNALLVPILALGRVVNVLYADAGRGAMVDPDGVGELLILATRIAQSYDALVARV